MSKASGDEMVEVKALLRVWDQSSNPIFLAAAGQLRQALRKDGHEAAAKTDLVRR